MEQKKTEKNTLTKKLLCIVIKKNKAKQFNSLNEKNIFENRKF